MNKFALQKDLLLVSQSNQYLFVLLAKLIAKTSNPDAVIAFLEDEKSTETGKTLRPLIDRMIESARTAR